MDDLIKRSDAIKAVLGITMYEARVPIATVIYNIKSLPSADRPQGWIPCSEKLPERDGNYLVSLAFEWGNEIEMGWLLDGEWANSNSHVTVAWMPLPEPWKGVDDD